MARNDYVQTSETNPNQCFAYAIGNLLLEMGDEEYSRMACEGIPEHGLTTSNGTIDFLHTRVLVDILGSKYDPKYVKFRSTNCTFEHMDELRQMIGMNDFSTEELFSIYSEEADAGRYVGMPVSSESGTIRMPSPVVGSFIHREYGIGHTLVLSADDIGPFYIDNSSVKRDDVMRTYALKGYIVLEPKVILQESTQSIDDLFSGDFNF